MRTDLFSCIRQITVKGALRLRDKQIEGYHTHTHWLSPFYSRNVLNENPVNYEGMYAVYDESVIKRSSEEDTAWAPLVNLLEADIPLGDLVLTVGVNVYEQSSPYAKLCHFDSQSAAMRLFHPLECTIILRESTSAIESDYLIPTP